MDTTIQFRASNTSRNAMNTKSNGSGGMQEGGISKLRKLDSFSVAVQQLEIL